MKYDIYEYIIPEAYISYFVNADSSGLDTQDLYAINKFENRLIKQFGHANITIDPDSELGFKHYNDINNLGDNCYTGIILVDTKICIV